MKKALSVTALAAAAATVAVAAEAAALQADSPGGDTSDTARAA